MSHRRRRCAKAASRRSTAQEGDVMTVRRGGGGVGGAPLLPRTRETRRTDGESGAGGAGGRGVAVSFGVEESRDRNDLCRRCQSSDARLDWTQSAAFVPKPPTPTLKVGPRKDTRKDTRPDGPGALDATWPFHTEPGTELLGFCDDYLWTSTQKIIKDTRPETIAATGLVSISVSSHWRL